ncbi:MAG: hypothetical protein AVO33_04190 [delta proteobacterium ML8_F1]|nr:MAG: hypothetical protein AVO33_04190 [delta proteobacterium ML8_F1]
MKHEIKKISRIVDELTTLFLKEDTNEVDFSIKILPEQTRITISAHATHFTEADVEQLKNILGAQRQYEVEEYYWQLAGECDDIDHELTLVGAMVDEATVEIKEGSLFIELIRYTK